MLRTHKHQVIFSLQKNLEFTALPCSTQGSNSTYLLQMFDLGHGILTESTDFFLCVAWTTLKLTV